MSNQVISCVADPTDLAGLMDQVTISAGSIKFQIDNARWDYAGWACDNSCFANQSNPDLTQGLGELEVKVEPLRYMVCVTRDLLADALFPVESWILGKVADAFRRTINNTIIAGGGVGKPIGILTSQAGIPICDASVATPPGTFTWQDLAFLKANIPAEWERGNGIYLMNQTTFSLLATMSDAVGRPLVLSSLQNRPEMTLFGSPIRIVSQMPDCLPGACPIAYGDWRRAYVIVRRSGPTMIVDNTTSFCVVFRFEQRLGGGTKCPNAARLLRIR
jgi:HK97 family phage major capsid protein